MKTKLAIGAFVVTWFFVFVMACHHQLAEQATRITEIAELRGLVDVQRLEIDKAHDDIRGTQNLIRELTRSTLDYVDGLKSEIEPALSDVCERVMSAVVKISDPDRGYGTGLIVDPRNGYVLTMSHIVESYDSLVVECHDDSVVHAKCVAVDDVNDLALLKMDPNDIAQLRVPKLRVADINDLRVGDTVFAVGTPHTMRKTVSRGVLSRKITRFSPYMVPYDCDYLIVDVVAGPGSSGGPVFNTRLEIVGLVTGPAGSYVRLIPCTSIERFLRANIVELR